MRTSALAAAIEAGRKGLIVPILVGPFKKIDQVATEAGIDLGIPQIEDVPHSHAAAAESRRACPRRAG